MRSLETQILAQLQEKLVRFGPALSAAGLSTGEPQIEVWSASDQTYTSEIRVTILRDGQIEDVLEFHIYRNGQAIVTVEEAADWYQTEFEKLCQAS